MKSICEYQGQFLEWDDDIGENETLKCMFFTDEGEWNEYCYCNEEERDDCKLYKYSKHIKEKNKEIDRLNNIIDKQDRDITTLTKDKIKLKNTIDGLEKLLEQMILDTKTPTVLNNSEKMAIRITIQHIQDKLKELKEGNNENNNKENN